MENRTHPAGDCEKSSGKDSPKTSITDAILDWFENHVEKEGIQIGDPLPSEDYIVNQTGMSRTSVREAVTRLRALGVVESKRKRGMRLVRSPNLVDLTRLLGSTTIPEDLIPHVGGFRSALELGLESEIFRRATKEDIAELRSIYEEMIKHAENPEEWHELDLHFHEKMIRITGNKVAIWLSNLFEPYFHHIRVYESTMSEVTKEKHRHIVISLENRDAIGFHLAMREQHFRKIPIDGYDAAGFVPPENRPDSYDTEQTNAEETNGFPTHSEPVGTKEGSPSQGGDNGR